MAEERKVEREPRDPSYRSGYLPDVSDEHFQYHVTGKSDWGEEYGMSSHHNKTMRRSEALLKKVNAKVAQDEAKKAAQKAAGEQGSVGEGRAEIEMAPDTDDPVSHSHWLFPIPNSRCMLTLVVREPWLEVA